MGPPGGAFIKNNDILAISDTFNEKGLDYGRQNNQVGYRNRIQKTNDGIYFFRYQLNGQRKTVILNN